MSASAPSFGTATSSASGEFASHTPTASAGTNRSTAAAAMKRRLTHTAAGNVSLKKRPNVRADTGR